MAQVVLDPAERPSTLRGARALFLSTLVGSLLATGLSAGFQSLDPLERIRWGPAQNVAGLVFTVWIIGVRVVLVRALGETRLEPTARWACAAAIASLAAFLTPWMPHVEGLAQVEFRIVMTSILVLGLASTLTTWWLVVRCRGDLPGWLAFGLPAGRLTVSAFSLGWVPFPGRGISAFVGSAGLAPWLAIGLLFDAATLFVLWGLARGRVAPGLPRVSSEPLFDRGPSIPPDRDVLIGGVLVLAGALVTVVTYLDASASGGRSVVTIGAIAYGGRRWLRGMRALLR